MLFVIGNELSPFLFVDVQILNKSGEIRHELG
jgi:hypothetical protein